MRSSYSDEELIKNIKDKAKELKRSPYCREVVGGHSAAKRFGTWNAALLKAGLIVNRDNTTIENGTRFGKLTITGHTIVKNNLCYRCICDCGEITLIRSDSLKKDNPTLSCGCLSEASRFKSEDITGKKYSMLTVIEFVGIDENEEEIWLCRCDCGNTVNVLKKNIYSSSKKSCGCRARSQRVEAAKQANKKLKETDWIEGTSILKISREKPIKSNTSGVTGVTWDEDREKWMAQIVFKGTSYFLGRYEEKEDAIKIRKEAEEKLHKEFLKSFKANKDSIDVKCEVEGCSNKVSIKGLCKRHYQQKWKLI